VDAESENRIHQVLAEFAKGRTTLLVAHRFATVLAADHIVVMDRGAILDSGSHEELLARCELYRNLYQTQFIDSGGQAP
jgi:ABC-type multidrug transport system fused ATPase/permease subunit